MKLSEAKNYRRGLVSRLSGPMLGIGTMASAPTTSSGASQTLARLWSATGDYFGGAIRSEWFTYNREAKGNGATVLVGTSFYHYGQAIEICMAQTSTAFLVKVNDRYVSLTPTATGTTGGANTWWKYDFGTTDLRRIDIIGFNTSFRGVAAGATDTIWPAPNRGPKTIIMGDSFSQGSPMIAQTGFADALGWDDVSASGVSSTGYLANGGGALPTFRGRVQSDVISQNPSVVGVYGGVNDGAQSPSAIQAEALLLYQTIATSLPGALIFATVNTGTDISGATSNALLVREAIRTACATAKAQGIKIEFCDIQEYPLVGTTPYALAVASTGAGSPSAGASAFGMTHAANLRPQIGSTWEVGTGSVRERFVVKTTTPATSTITNITTTRALQYNHTAGDAATLVGGSFYTGSGNTGATTGFGNSDIITSADGLHPNQTFGGSYLLGYAMAERFMRAFGGL